MREGCERDFLLLVLAVTGTLLLLVLAVAGTLLLLVLAVTGTLLLLVLAVTSTLLLVVLPVEERHVGTMIEDRARPLRLEGGGKGSRQVEVRRVDRWRNN